MITNRPKQLLDRPDYNRFPAEPFQLGFEVVPELARTSLGPLGGIQPVTTAMFEVAGNTISDLPSPAEIELFKKLGSRFQLISVVANLARLKHDSGGWRGIPYSISLMPASKRGAIDERPIEDIAHLDLEKFRRETQPCYTGYDPFVGNWGLYAPLGTLIQQKFGGALDELGIVIGAYYLATAIDPEQVVEVPLGFNNPRLEEKYGRHRGKLLYRPFTEVRPRRIWGVESPIELFLYQELLQRDIEPQPQVLFYEDGSVHTSLYHLWRDLEFRHTPGMITEADFYLAEQKLAIFCDSGSFHRGPKARQKDAAIDARLAAIGVRSVRIFGREIVNDLNAAADRVSKLL